MVVSHLIYLPLALKREKIYHISEPFRKHSYFLSSLIFLAGIPAIVQSGSLIECTTTALAPMVTSLAIFISPITIAPAPISTLLPITGQQPIMWSSPPPPYYLLCSCHEVHNSLLFPSSILSHCCRGRSSAPFQFLWC